ncbi:MAG: YgiQ family radical SAM protein [Bacteroidales bacterium]|nr:YgiQ family radical SAM protein [Bacteroidales bacterium]
MDNYTDLSLWLPTSKKEVELRGWDELDVVLFSGDAYVDHPSFGAAVVGRVIEAAGFRVAVVPQPNWRDDLRDFKKLGRPRHFFAVSPGAMDSMVNHYTANRRRRSDDAYTPGGKAGFRPDMPSIVYTQILKQLFPDVPVVLGGIEASLRRVTHYDYWQDRLRPSILIESGADMLIYGMGEKPLTEIVTLLKRGVPFASLKTVPQTAFVIGADDELPKNKNWNTIELNSHDDCLRDKVLYAKNFKHVEEESNKKHAARLVQRCGDRKIVLNPQYLPMTEREVDFSFDLPYTHLPHPRYKGKGDIPAYEMIKNSVCLHRGCFGGCSFCTISAHQGKFIASRSEKSVLREIEKIKSLPGFKGYLSDLGGPSANMYGMHGRDESKCDICARPSCIFPKVCANLNTDHSRLIALYRKVDSLGGIKKSFIGSGVRYDMLLNDNATPEEKKSHEEYIRELVARHVSGRLKVAPEHTSDAVLNVMRKPSFSLFGRFKREFDRINKQCGLNQQIIPYFISSHPGCHEADMAELACLTHDMDFQLEQVQDFTPTPMTVSTVIYYSGVHPYTLKPVFTARTPDEKLRQRMFFFWYKPEYKQKIKDALKRINRFDLIERLFGKKTDKNRKNNIK